MSAHKQEQWDQLTWHRKYRNVFSPNCCHFKFCINAFSASAVTQRPVAHDDLVNHNLQLCLLLLVLVAAAAVVVVLVVVTVVVSAAVTAVVVVVVVVDGRVWTAVRSKFTWNEHNRTIYTNQKQKRSQNVACTELHSYMRFLHIPTALLICKWLSVNRLPTVTSRHQCHWQIKTFVQSTSSK